MADTLELRPFVLADVPAVAEIEAMASPHPWSEELFRGEFAVPAGERHWIVAEHDGEVVGFAGMMHVGGEGHLMNVAVRPDHRRRGIARALCGSVFDDARRRGAEALTLEVRASNAAAIELYRSFGFAPVGARPGYYRNADGTTEDALILWLHDLQHGALRRPDLDEEGRR